MSHKDKEKYRQYKIRRNKAVTEWRQRVKEKAVAAMGGECQCCGYNKHISALEFHHLNPSEKEIGISTGGCTRSYEKMKNELKKCILVCANCHREIHAKIKQIPKNFVTLDETTFTPIIRTKKEKIKKERIRKIILTQEELIIKLNKCNGNKSKLARELNVSETAIRKRIKNCLTSK